MIILCPVWSTPTPDADACLFPPSAIKELVADANFECNEEGIVRSISLYSLLCHLLTRFFISLLVPVVAVMSLPSCASIADCARRNSKRWITLTSRSCLSSSTLTVSVNIGAFPYLCLYDYSSDFVPVLSLYYSCLAPYAHIRADFDLTIARSFTMPRPSVLPVHRALIIPAIRCH